MNFCHINGQLGIWMRGMWNTIYLLIWEGLGLFSVTMIHSKCRFNICQYLLFSVTIIFIQYICLFVYLFLNVFGTQFLQIPNVIGFLFIYFYLFFISSLLRNKQPTIHYYDLLLLLHKWMKYLIGNQSFAPQTMGQLHHRDIMFSLVQISSTIQITYATKLQSCREK